MSQAILKIYAWGLSISALFFSESLRNSFFARLILTSDKRPPVSGFWLFLPFFLRNFTILPSEKRTVFAVDSLESLGCSRERLSGGNFGPIQSLICVCECASSNVSAWLNGEGPAYPTYDEDRKRHPNILVFCAFCDV